MNKRRQYRFDESGQAVSGFFVCILFFLCGTFMGIFSARALDATGAFILRGNVLSLIESILGDYYTAPNFWMSLWLTGRYHLIAVFLGFSVLGVFLLPVLAAVRGFYLSFSIAALIRAFGPSAFPLALSLFGIWAVFTVPTLFFLLNHSFRTAVQLAGSLFSGPKVLFSHLYGRKFTVLTFLSFFTLVVVVLLELYFTRALVLWTSSFLSL